MATDLEQEVGPGARTPGDGRQRRRGVPGTGLVKGLGVNLKHLFQRSVKAGPYRPRRMGGEPPPPRAGGGAVATRPPPARVAEPARAAAPAPAAGSAAAAGAAPAADSAPAAVAAQARAPAEHVEPD